MPSYGVDGQGGGPAFIKHREIVSDECRRRDEKDGRRRNRQMGHSEKSLTGSFSPCFESLVTFMSSFVCNLLGSAVSSDFGFDSCIFTLFPSCFMHLIVTV